METCSRPNIHETFYLHPIPNEDTIFKNNKISHFQNAVFVQFSTEYNVFTLLEMGSVILWAACIKLYYLN